VAFAQTLNDASESVRPSWLARWTRERAVGWSSQIETLSSPLVTDT